MSDDIESGGGSHGSYAASSDNGSEAISSHPPPIILPTGSEPLANATGGSEAILPSSNSVPIHPQLKSIFLYLLLHASTLGIIALAVPQLLLRIYDDDSSDSAFAQSLISALTGVIGLLAFPTIGMLSDHYGRKPFILSALLGSATAFLLIGAINTLGALIAAAIVRGFTDVSYTISFAVLGDVTPKSFFLATYGRLSASGALGIVCGPILALICFQIDADRTAFFLAAFIELCNIVWISVKFKETLFWFDREAALQQGEAADQLPQPVRETFREMCARRTLNPFKALLILRTSPALWLLAFALFLSMIGFTGMLSVFFLFTHEKYKWGATENAANVLLFGVCSIVANALLLPWLLKKSGVTEQRLLALSVGCSLAQNLLWAFLPASVAWVIFLSSPVLMPSMILIALLRGLISRQIEPNKQGELQGALTCLISLASILGPLSLNSLFGYFVSDRAPFYFPGAPFFLVFLLQATIGGVLYYVTTAHLSQVEVHAYARSPSHEQGDHAIELRERIMPEEEAEEEQDRTVIGKDAVPRPSPSSAHSQYLDPPSQTRNSPPSTSRGGASSISPNQPRQRDLEDAASPRLTNQPVRNVERATAQGKARADSYGELRDEELVE